MTRLDDAEAQVLEQARRALGPTMQDQERVLQSLLVRISAPPGTTPSPSNGVRAKSATWPLRAGWSVVVIGAIALSGGLGYRTGFEAGIAKQRSGNLGTNASLPAPPEPSREAAPTPVATAEHAPRMREPDHESVSHPPVTHVDNAPHTASGARPSAESVVAIEKLGLDEEVRQLRRVERAIRESNPRFALVLLEELEQAIPKGQLQEERDAARIMASCQLDADDAVADARTFIKKHGSSAYRSRVVEICRLASAPSERISPAPGTDAPEMENQR
jgi:hypothetical protein